MLAGAPDEVIKAARSRQDPEADNFEVHEDNWSSVVFFLEFAATQWNQSLGMSGVAYFGLRYEGIEAAMRMIATPRGDRKQLLQDLCIMERAALPILNQPSDKTNVSSGKSGR
jgi:hypothetical protein